MRTCGYFHAVQKKTPIGMQVTLMEVLEDKRLTASGFSIFTHGVPFIADAFYSHRHSESRLAILVRAEGNRFTEDYIAIIPNGTSEDLSVSADSDLSFTPETLAPVREFLAELTIIDGFRPLVHFDSFRANGSSGMQIVGEDETGEPRIQGVHQMPAEIITNSDVDRVVTFGHVEERLHFYPIDINEDGVPDTAVLNEDRVDIVFGEIPKIGDANGDDEVDFHDFIVLSRNFGKQVFPWNDGDFNGDAIVKFDDFILLAQNFGL